MIFAFLVPYCMVGIAGPALQSIIVRNVFNNEEGELQGSLISLLSLNSILGPTLMNGLFACYTRPGAELHFSGVSFLSGGFFMLSIAVVAYFAMRAKWVKTNICFINESTS